MVLRGEDIHYSHTGLERVSPVSVSRSILFCTNLVFSHFNFENEKKKKKSLRQLIEVFISRESSLFIKLMMLPSFGLLSWENAI